ncbi:MAG: CopG family transcriptional regulator [Thermomicrobiales bacterium]
MCLEHPIEPLTPAESPDAWEAQGWAVEPTPVEVAERVDATFAIRLDQERSRLLNQAARLAGVTRAEFIREAALRAAQATLADPPVPLRRANGSASG